MFPAGHTLCTIFRRAKSLTCLVRSNNLAWKSKANNWSVKKEKKKPWATNRLLLLYIIVVAVTLEPPAGVTCIFHLLRTVKTNQEDNFSHCLWRLLKTTLTRNTVAWSGQLILVFGSQRYQIRWFFFFSLFLKRQEMYVRFPFWVDQLSSFYNLHMTKMSLRQMQILSSICG